MENDSPRDVTALSESTPERLYAEGFLTIKQAQEQLGRSRSFLARATRAGVLPRYRIGYGRGRVVLAEEDVAALARPRPADPEAGGLPRRTPRDRGFTLLELLVTVLIIGILTGIAVPVFLNQKARAYDAAVRADLATAAQTIEGYWAGESASWNDLRTRGGGVVPAWFWTISTPAGASAWNASGLPTLTFSRGTQLTLTGVTAPSGTWTHLHGPGDYCLTAVSARAARFNYAAGSGARHYDRLALWDPTLGGAVTIQDVARAVRAGEAASCEGYATAWLAAGGVV